MIRHKKRGPYSEKTSAFSFSSCIKTKIIVTYCILKHFSPNTIYSIYYNCEKSKY